MEARTQKRIVIGAAYLIVIGAIAFSVYWLNYRPTCSDGIMNGKEEGVDCGTLACAKVCPNPVQSLEVESIVLARTSAGDFDFAFQVYNPNSDHGASLAVYDLVFKDRNDQELARKKGNSFYILPGQTKYVVIPAIRNKPELAILASVEITSVGWRNETNVVSINLMNTKDALTIGPDQPTFETTIFNDSDFDFDNVDVAIIVFDDSDRVITTNTTNIRTLLSQTERYVKVSWPFTLPQDARVFVEVSTNVFENSNFLQRSGAQEEFQQYFQEGKSIFNF